MSDTASDLRLPERGLDFGHDRGACQANSGRKGKIRKLERNMDTKNNIQQDPEEEGPTDMRVLI